MRFILLGTLAAMLCYYAYTEDDEQDRRERQRLIQIDQMDLVDDEFIFSMGAIYEDKFQNSIINQNQRQIDNSIAIEKFQKLSKFQQTNNEQKQLLNKKVHHENTMQHQVVKNEKYQKVQRKLVRDKQSIKIIEQQRQYGKRVQQNSQQKLKVGSKHRIIVNKAKQNIKSKPINKVNQKPLNYKTKQNGGTNNAEWRHKKVQSGSKQQQKIKSIFVRNK